MPSLVVKPERDEDFYVVWSTIVDNVTYAGTREQLQRNPGPDFATERFDRADLYGTSARPDGEMAGWLGWDTRGFIVDNVMDHPLCPGSWWLPRERLRAFVDGDLSVLEPLPD